jgi:tRNA pseudouridine55 synthase
MIKPRAVRRDVHGILLLDKPIGMTSNAALQQIKHHFAAKKAGHTGSLDPLATGMLPLCLGEATKFSQFLLEADKVYSVSARLGIKTATADGEGEIIAEREIGEITEHRLLEMMKKFLGEIQQIPSMYSAIKHQGRPLYELARKGIEVERKSRVVKIYDLKLLDYGVDFFNFEVRCSKGTYVRTLVEDMGEILGCGAHVSALRRLIVGPYQSEKMITLDQIAELAQQEEKTILDNFLLPINTTVSNWPEVILSEAAAYYLRRGQAVIVPHAPTSGMVSMQLKGGRFLGVGEIIEDGRVAPRRLVA